MHLIGLTNDHSSFSEKNPFIRYTGMKYFSFEIFKKFKGACQYGT